MNVPAIVTVSATMPFFAAAMGEETSGDRDNIVALLYFAAVGLLVSFAALIDSVFDLTSWFGLMPAGTLGLF